MTSPLSTSSTSTMPSASATAVSIESASRLRRSGRITRRSTTTEMSCLYFLSRSIVLLEPAQLAVHLHAREALGAQLLEQLAVLALAPAHHRRQHHELASPSSSVITWSTICSADWAAIGRPQL